MLTYDTGIANNPPITAPMQQQALAALFDVVNDEQGGLLHSPEDT